MAALAITATLLAYPSMISVVSANPSTNSVQPLAAATTTTTAATDIASTTTSSAASSTTSTQTGGDQDDLRVTFSDAKGNQGPSPYHQGDGRFQHQSPVNLTVGQTITVTSTQGNYWVIGTTSTNGSASGTLTFTVTSKLSAGYTLSLTSGSIVVAGTTYTVSSGSAQMRLSANAMSGQGSTTPAGQFLLQAQARGTFVGTSGSVLLDFTNGTTEYAVALTGTIK
jgi:hypothetical protein